MKKNIDLLTAAMAFGVASYVAIILNCLAREELGLSNGQICKSAVFAALLIAVALGMVCFRAGAGRPW
jgi:hypothetical protein